MGQPFLCDDARATPDATHPECRLETAHAHSLLGLAPDGVYRASPVTSAPVSSYLTLSPLPRIKSGAVCFLWHFPSVHTGRTLSAVLSPWSPDFPLTPRDQRLPGRLVELDLYKITARKPIP